jgi:two-component system cell cycle response regulator
MMRILVAEDEAISRRLLMRTLEQAGYEVIAVENGAKACRELCHEGGPRLALLDWMMPEIDGPGVCRQVRKRSDHPYVYIVLLTAKEAKEDVVAGLESGADDYLTKPFDTEELKARLRAGLRVLDLEDKLVEAREEMRYRATHDSLTALLNRGVVMDLLNRELARSQRERNCTAVILADIDHFKNINDMYGHPAGDDVLREISRRLVATVRSYDFIGRFGGEEFLIVLNNCDPASAPFRAEQIRQAICAKPMQTRVGGLNVTISAGLLLTTDWGALPIEQVLSEVDSALYSAKAAGRNCLRRAAPVAGEALPSILRGGSR